VLTTLYKLSMEVFALFVILCIIVYLAHAKEINKNGTYGRILANWLSLIIVYQMGFTCVAGILSWLLNLLGCHIGGLDSLFSFLFLALLFHIPLIPAHLLLVFILFKCSDEENAKKGWDE
jgi:hypothetical protein